ncbi:hypothetical protein PSACC_01604 [Paramicrosporidium saccamoebae]|uniref:Uncharacterized protein n=1 Tax=Paramicrosporidium saccamoebae TaxID=1246581 RepID=A0A2H9TLD8_9FUNG|nr:hypothetical protein PSACC_01604 [Paramicrosporidium saccamoebae]
MALLGVDCYACLESEETLGLYHGQECSITQLNRKITDAQIVRNRVNDKLVAIYGPAGPVVSVDTRKGETTLLVPQEQFLRDRIVWCAWHEASATGNHVSVLTAAGSFIIANATSGRIEMRTKVRSPEDYTLRCVNATTLGEVLWVAMENGDLLAMSPILPSPCLADELSACPDEEELVNNEEWAKFYCKFESRKHQLNRPLKPMAGENEPKVQGPFLLQPEPLDDSSAVALKAFRHDGMEFLAVASLSGRLNIFMLEHAIRPCWEKSLDDQILTLVESIRLPPSTVLSLDYAEPYELLLVLQDRIMSIQMNWLTEMAVDGDIKQISKSQVSTIKSNLSIVDAMLFGRSVMYLDEAMNVDSAHIPRSAEPLLKSIAEHFVPTVAPKLDAAPLPSICLPKLCVPANLKTIKFPRDLDENSLEETLKIIQSWRMQTLIKCAKLAEELKRRMLILNELGMRQKEWANLVVNRAKAAIQHTASAADKIARLDKGLPRVGENLQPSQGGTELASILSRLETLQTKLSTTSPPVLDSLLSQTSLLEHIQDQIKALSFEKQ